MSQIHRLYDNIAISNKRSLEVKKIFALSVVAILLLATGCEMGKDGETFLAYSWTSLPLYIYDENPSTPSTITNEEYFRTNEGRYYFEYTAWVQIGGEHIQSRQILVNYLLMVPLLTSK